VTARPDRETTDERIARLRQATEAIAPPADLAARLAGCAFARAALGAARPANDGGYPVTSRRRGISGVVLPFGRRALVAAAFAAAASLALAYHGVGQENDALTGDAADTAFWEP
jgi:hypothetical protein